MFVLPKFGSLRDGTSALLKISDSQKLGKFFKLGVAIIFSLLVDRFFTQKNKKSSGTTRVQLEKAIKFNSAPKKLQNLKQNARYGNQRGFQQSVDVFRGLSSGISICIQGEGEGKVQYSHSLVLSYQQHQPLVFSLSAFGSKLNEMKPVNFSSVVS